VSVNLTWIFGIEEDIKTVKGVKKNKSKIDIWKDVLYQVNL